MKLLQRSAFQKKDKGEIVFKKGTRKGKWMMLMIEGNLLQEATGKVYSEKGEFVDEPMLYEPVEEVFEDNIIIDSNGMVSILPIDVFEKIIGGQLM